MLVPTIKPNSCENCATVKLPTKDCNSKIIYSPLTYGTLASQSCTKTGNKQKIIYLQFYPTNTPEFSFSAVTSVILTV